MEASSFFLSSRVLSAPFLATCPAGRDSLRGENPRLFQERRCMPISKVFGYAARALGQPCEPFRYEPPKLGEHDVRISVTHCGVCHTDIQAIDNYYGITTFPFVPGHEIVGTVLEAGPRVVGLKEGDRVGIGWQGRSCGKCDWCVKGETQLCM